ncbi:MAG: hypothetical protein ACKV2V_20815 [Blastocatellia bacterium]
MSEILDHRLQLFVQVRQFDPESLSELLNGWLQLFAQVRQFRSEILFELLQPRLFSPVRGAPLISGFAIPTGGKAGSENSARVKNRRKGKHMTPDNQLPV